MECQKLKLIDNQELNRFEIQFNDSSIDINYEKTRNHIRLIHTDSSCKIVKPEIRDKLILYVLEYIKAQQLLLIPSCPYVALFIMKNPEWKKQVFE